MNKLKALWGRVSAVGQKVTAPFADKSNPFFIQNLIASVIIAFLAVSAVSMKLIEPHYSDPAYIKEVSLLLFAGAVVTVAAVLIAASKLFSAARVIPVTMVVTLTVFCAFLQNKGDRNIWIGIGAAIICYLACRWIFNRFETPFSEYKIGFRFVKAAICVMFLLFTVYMSAMGVARFYSFTYDTFDFGIFAQMFAYMKDTGLPLTSVERNEILSHFAVHFSPFFYVLLPGYMLFSTPAYLCVMQTLCIGVSVFAVYGIAKELGFTPKMTLLVSALFLSYPALSYGLHFDFHENKFLTFCILFTVYFMLKKKYIPFYIFAVLLCTVKEDAAIYLVAIALFMIFREKRFGHGSITLGLALAYFVFALAMIQVCGATEENQFGYRYSSFEIDGESSIGNIIIVTVMNFGYTLLQMFQQEKIEFLLWMFLPVLFMPFMTKKISTLLLLAPMLLVNLMTNWPYQYDVDFQYTFGTAAMIIVCAIFTLKEMSPATRKTLLTAAVMTSLAITLPRVIARNDGYIKGYWENREIFHESIDYIHENVDRNTVVGAEGNVIPVMHDYPYMLLDPHDDRLAASIEYFVAKSDDSDISYLTDRGFELYGSNGYVSIYKNPHYVPIG